MAKTGVEDFVPTLTIRDDRSPLLLSQRSEDLQYGSGDGDVDSPSHRVSRIPWGCVNYSSAIFVKSLLEFL